MHKIISFNPESPTAQKTKGYLLSYILRFQRNSHAFPGGLFQKDGVHSSLTLTCWLRPGWTPKAFNPGDCFTRVCLLRFPCLHRAWMPNPPGTEAKCTSPPLHQHKHGLIWSSASAVPPMLIYIKLHYKWVGFQLRWFSGEQQTFKHSTLQLEQAMMSGTKICRVWKAFTSRKQAGALVYY